MYKSRNIAILMNDIHTHIGIVIWCTRPSWLGGGEANILI